MSGRKIRIPAMGKLPSSFSLDKCPWGDGFDGSDNTQEALNERIKQYEKAFEVILINLYSERSKKCLKMEVGADELSEHFKSVLSNLDKTFSSDDVFMIVPDYVNKDDA